jgi:hypothetical protein
MEEDRGIVDEMVNQVASCPGIRSPLKSSKSLKSLNDFNDFNDLEEGRYELHIEREIARQ